MRRLFWTLDVVVRLILTAALISGCGGISHKTEKVASSTTTTSTVTAPPPETARLATTPTLRDGLVAIIGHHKITKATLASWITEQAGEGYYLGSKQHRVPARLISEPADYAACMNVLKASHPPDRPTASLKQMCERLYHMVKRAAIAYLVSSYWALEFAAAHGITVTASEAKRGLARYVSEIYRKRSEFRPDLAARSRNMRQELFILRNDLIAEKLMRKVMTSAQFRNEARRDAETAICPPSYIVEHCKGYRASPTTRAHTPSVEAMLEEIAHWRGT